MHWRQPYASALRPATERRGPEREREGILLEGAEPEGILLQGALLEGALLPPSSSQTRQLVTPNLNWPLPDSGSLAVRLCKHRHGRKDSSLCSSVA